MTKQKSPFTKPIQAVFSISVIFSANDQMLSGMNPWKLKYISFHCF